VFENTELHNPGGFTVGAVLSNDDGRTWHSRFQLYQPPSNTQSAGAPQVYNVWGVLVVSFMTNEDHNLGTGKKSTQYKRLSSSDKLQPGYDGGDVKVITSNTAGTDWSPSFTVGPSPAHWPGIFNLDPTHFLALYGHDGWGPTSQIWSI
jgi:hypothetical protein